MDRLQSMQVFVSVVELGSFSRTAEKLNMSNATVTTHVASLENHLGVRLLNRTTRRLSLTDDGAAYLEHSKQILAQIEETEAMLARGRVAPRGKLRVDMPVDIGRNYVVPALPRFAAQYPELQVVATLNDQMIDLVAEGTDAAIRVGALADSSMIGRRVYDARYLVCAAPDYLERMGEPTAPEQLGEHQCLAYYAPSAGKIIDWEFEKDGARITRTPNSQLSLTSVSALVDLAVDGAGILYTVDIAIAQQIAARTLKPILKDWTRRDRLPISVVYPQNRHLSAKVRAFVDFVAGLFPRPAARPPEPA